MVNNRHKTGKIGEQKALDFLMENNYEILFSNWRFQRCEIDIVAKKNNELIFVEVKTRTSSLLSEENIISISQQKRIINAADHFIKQNELDYNIRFDMIFVEISLNSFKLTHFKEFFKPTID